MVIVCKGDTTMNRTIRPIGLPMEINMYGIAPPNLDYYFIKAIALVESGGNPTRVNTKEKAVGIFQIRPIAVADINRIIGKRVFTLKDRYNAEKSVQMMYIYLGYYGNVYTENMGKSPTDETYARIWNGGGYGYAKYSTMEYWYKVKNKIKQLKDYYDGRK